ncbi:hypothetical protein [Sulfobacillus harzensis]|uniref:Uncharacterized protein n=1 Tax=Sulfobacillus harzensis TaxID=2729629 RepID=A0A7Y0L5Y4_9FIRM|nr:hypothetical protein [Sulfobacillus harzensis]NMP23557.1 hypothetical protein [Sulfobacillus harzensis]
MSGQKIPGTLMVLGLLGIVSGCGSGAKPASAPRAIHSHALVKPTVSPSASNAQITQSVTATSAVHFDTTISQAMQYLKDQSVIPVLMAPTEPGFAPVTPHLAAMANGHGNNYSVNLFVSDKRLPINSSILSTAPYEQADAIVGSFGAVRYTSPAVAEAALYQSPSQSIAPAYQPPPNVSAETVNLGKGILGTEYAGASLRAPLVLWHEGDWTLEVWDGTPAEDVAQAEKLVRYLHTHLLPETFGVLGENIARDGHHTTAEWLFGSTICAPRQAGMRQRVKFSSSKD